MKSTRELNTQVEEEEKTYDDFKNELVKYRELRAKVIEFVKANNYDEAVKIYRFRKNQ